MMIPKISFPGILLLLTHMLNAQILTVDKAALDADSSGFFQGSVNLNFNVNNRSSTPEKDATYVGLKATADLVYFSESHAYILINSLDYFSVSEGPFISTGHTHFRINFLRKKAISYEGFTQAQYDDGRNMPARYLLGAAIKLRLPDNGDLVIYTGIGGMWEYEKWKTGDGNYIEKKLLKSSNYVNATYDINDKIDFSTTAYYQTGYDAEADVFRNRISLDLDLEAKLTKTLAFVTTFSAQYEDKPIIPIKKYIYSLTNGLVLEF